MQTVLFKDLGVVDYRSAWDLQESLLQDNVKVKSAIRSQESTLESRQSEVRKPVQESGNLSVNCQPSYLGDRLTTVNYLLLLEHSPVYTLGKSGKMENILISEQQLKEKGIEFFKTNRGGDITYHGPDQLVGYPILDLENFDTDIGGYLRNLEQVIIQTMAEYDLQGDRSRGETGVWLDPDVKGNERKICAIGVRCSRWITMHGFAFNVNNDLSYFDNIIPCGIQNKQVTSIQKELGRKVDMQEVKEKIKRNFMNVFNVNLR